MKSKRVYKIAVSVPEADADKLREALGNAGAGVIGTYSHCTFSVKGTGRFMPLPGARPAIGSIGKLEEVKEERIETICEPEKLQQILAAIRANHPYESPAVDAYLIEIFE